MDGKGDTMTDDEIIRAQAYRCAYRMRVNPDLLWSEEDLVQEGYIIAEKARKKWNPKLSAWNTFLTRLLMNGYANILSNHHRHALPVTHMEYEPPSENTSVVVDRKTLDPKLMRATDGLSQRARTFLQCVFSPPPELRERFEQPTNTHLTGKIVQKFLGWNWLIYKQVKDEVSDWMQTAH